MQEEELTYFNPENKKYSLNKLSMYSPIFHLQEKS